MKRQFIIAVTVCATLALLVATWNLRGVLLLFFLALGVAAALRPAVIWLEKRGLPQGLALAVSYISTFGVLVGLMILASGPLMEDLADFARDAKAAYEVVERPPEKNQGTMTWAARELLQLESAAGLFAEAEVSSAVVSMFGVTMSALEAIGNTIVVIVLSLYWNISRDHFERLWLSLLDIEPRTTARAAWQSVELEVGNYLRSETVQCVLAAVPLWMGFSAMQYPYPALLAAMSAIAWLVPWAGVLLAVSATVLLAIPQLLLVGEPAFWQTVLPAVVYGIAVLTLLEYFVEPRFFNRGRYNSLLLMFVVILLTETWGVWGLLLGPPLGAAIQIVAGYTLIKARATTTTAPTLSTIEIEKRIEALRENSPEVVADTPRIANLLERLAQLAQESKKLTSS